MNTAHDYHRPPRASKPSRADAPLDLDYMDDTPQNPEKDFNKIDLSQLQGFSFGTQWTQDKTSPSDRRERTDRPRREGGGPERRDRRAFRKPAGSDAGAAPDYGHAAPGGSEQPRERRNFSDDRGPRRDFRGPRRDGMGGPRGGYQPRGEFQERGPYDSPFFNVAFYPEDTSFNALAKTIRSSCRTIELFEIARTVVGKLDRFVVVLTRKTADAKPVGDAGNAAPAPRNPLYLSVPDGMPFDTEEAAVAHVLANHLGRFFDLDEVEIDPPKGNFLVINKCGVTGELLGPPNYHRYAHIVQQHHAAKLSRMPFEAFRSKIETVRDPEVVNQWLEKMKKATRYTWKQSAKPVAAPAKVAAEPATPATAEAVAEVAAQEGSTTPETAPALTFDNFEDARLHLLTHAREKAVRAVEHARFHGKLLETMPQGEIRRAIEGALERQRRFPLDTANALRGRLRREHFTIFKKGSKGISYVCAVKRKFRVPGQTFAESISALINFIEANPMVRASALTSKFLGIKEPAAEKPAADKPAAVAAAPAETPAAAIAAEGSAETAAPAVEPAPAAETPAAETQPTPAAETPVAETQPAAAAEAPAAPAEPVLTIEERAKISRMQGDLRWLVTEGYVTEFIDGRLFAPPPMVEARKKEVEAEEHDPENFPEAPVSNPPFENAPANEAPTPTTAEVAPKAQAEPESPESAGSVGTIAETNPAPAEVPGAEASGAVAPESTPASTPDFETLPAATDPAVPEANSAPAPTETEPALVTAPPEEPELKTETPPEQSTV